MSWEVRMTWNAGEREELAREYARIGFKPGDLWPAPPEWLSPRGILEMMRRIPDGAGREGFIAELARLKRE